jgi:single-stranded-DNA-specific exonuclease
MTHWIEPAEINAPAELQNYVMGHPLVAKVLAQRGITSPSQAGGFLDPRLYTPAPATDLPNLEMAADRVALAIRKGETICVWGDFDVDGQTSTTLFVSMLRDLGAKITYHIPIRGKESHGIKLEVLKDVLASGTQMILTCDTGIAEHESIAYAQSHGVDVVVTDHHVLSPTLPNAHALVNPQLLEPDHPLRDLPGVGVAFKLAEELYRRAGRLEDAEKLLDLAALGIVADVAVQRADTRYLLQRGLDVLRNTERLGLQTLFELAELNPTQISEEHIGFAIAPRLNALGRLGDANGIVEFLTTKDLTQARVVAQQLEGLNAKRKLLTSQIYQAALAQIEQDPSLLDFAALVLTHPAWEVGVIGIVAGRLAERFHRPAVLLAGGISPSIARGSARSVGGVNITEAIAAHAAMLITFGGHPMAAGLSLEADRIPAFRRALSETVGEMRGGIQTAPLQIDGFLPLSDLSLDLIEDIARLAPFGSGNPPLTLASRNLVMKSSTIIGRTREHVHLFVEDETGEVQKVFWWQGADNPLPEGRFDLAYTVRASDYRGERQMQIEWVDFRPAEGSTIEGVEPRSAGLEIVDYRQAADPLRGLHSLQGQGLQVWAEGEAKKEVEGRDRFELFPGQELAIWTIPPGPLEWQHVLEQMRPKKVYLFALAPEAEKTSGFLKRLAGLLKYSLRANKEQVEIEKLAAALAHREKTIRTGLEWLVEKGLFEVVWISRRVFRVKPGTGVSGSALPEIENRLFILLEETLAYRKFFRKASLQKLRVSS